MPGVLDRRTAYMLPGGYARMSAVTSRAHER